MTGEMYVSDDRYPMYKIENTISYLLTIFRFIIEDLKVTATFNSKNNSRDLLNLYRILSKIPETTINDLHIVLLSSGFL